MIARRVVLAAMAGGMMRRAQAADIPRKAPEFVVDMPGGGKMTPAQHRGKVLLFGFILPS
ncbi:MAG: hypothetical protein R2729_15215 [Bryobacteraceae bacterium]